jgi:hypothetical protein
VDIRVWREEGFVTLTGFAVNFENYQPTAFGNVNGLQAQ